MTIRSRRRAVLAVTGPLVAIVAAGGRAAAQEFQVDPGAENVVRFISRASIEEFEGVTDRIDGYVLLDAPALSADTGGEGTEVYLEVDLGSLDTGIGLRNRHMRDNYLEVGRYPFASFRARIESTNPGAGRSYRVTARGTLSIHGVERERTLTCRVEPRGEGHRARCEFEVLLSDHDIEIPKIMFLKLADEIRLELDFSVIPAPARNGDTS